MNDPLVDGDLSLRAIQESDLGQLRTWRNDWTVRAYTREYRLLTEMDQLVWYESLHKKPPDDLMFMIHVGGDRTFDIGACGLTKIDWHNRNAEVSIYIGHEASRGRGLGKRVVQMLEKYAFGELGLFKLWAEIYDFNRESLNLFDAASFKEVAFRPFQVWRDGEWQSSHIFERYAHDWQKERGEQ